MGEILISRIQSSEHKIGCVLICNEDPLVQFLKNNNIEYKILPDFLNRKMSEIKKMLSDELYSRQFRNWLDDIAGFDIDLGVTIWGKWVPPGLFRLPKSGFINYHPAPLPELRGMEPDTFAILESRKSIHGTVHFLNEEFDCGDIIRKTRVIPIRKYDTPLSVLKKLDLIGIETIIKAVNDIAMHRHKIIMQDFSCVSQATVAMARQESYVRWNSDTLDIIERKYRAFCGQDIGIRLKGLIEGRVCVILEMEFYRGVYRGNLGEIVGRYIGEGRFNNGYIINVSGGLVVVLAGEELLDPDHDCGHIDYILPPRKLLRKTKKNIVLRSLSKATCKTTCVS